jgi:predicted RNA-binding protein with PUA domain
MRPAPAHADPIAPTRTCRNCNSPVTGEYCASCGQETQVKLPTARVFLREATGRYVSLDGRM